MTTETLHICPVEKAGALDSKIRRWIQNPSRLLKPHIKAGMTVLDLGCGPGFFTLEMARLVQPYGKVIAADMQLGMLEQLQQKIHDTPYQDVIHMQQTASNDIRVEEPVDFVLAFYMVHEVKDKKQLFRQLKDIVHHRGSILMVEPKFHVTGNQFKSTISNANEAGFRVIAEPKLGFSRAVLLGIN